MMDITVKTLDGQNKKFCVPENMTVQQFKEKIANSIDLTVETQRLIFQGRVMQDEKLLKDYDVHGKVIHVVHRPPPSARPSGATGAGTPGPTGAHGHRDANNFVNLVQDTILGMGEIGRNARISTRTSDDGSSLDVHIHLGQNPSGQVESESQLRINQARRMLAIARENLQRLENPQESRDENSSTSPMEASESQEVSSSQPDTQTASQAQSSSSSSSPEANRVTGSQSSEEPDSSSTSRRTEASSSGSGPSEPTSGQSRSQTGQPRQTLVRPRISALGEMLREVHDVNRRFQPYLERYQQLLIDDPQLSEQEIEENQRLCNAVGEILHAISHCYHSLSDLMIDLNLQVPRHLYAAFISPPVQTAVIQQTIPVHVNTTLRVQGSPQSVRRNTATQSGVSTASAATSTSTPSTNASSQTPSTSTQSTGTTTGASPAGVFPPGALPPGVIQSGTTGQGDPFMVFEMGPDAVGGISAHVINSESEGTPNLSSTTTSTAPTGPEAMAQGIPPDLIQNIVSSVMQAHAGPRLGGAVFVDVGNQRSRPPFTSRSFPTAAAGRPGIFTHPPGHPGQSFADILGQAGIRSTGMNTASTETNSNATQTSTGQTSSSETQTSTANTNTSGTQTRPRTAAFVLPGMPHQAMRPVDPYLPCSSRHFLRQQVRNATGQPGGLPGQDVNFNDNVNNIMSGLLGQVNQPSRGAANTATATPSGVSSSTTRPGAVPSTATSTRTSQSGSSSADGTRHTFRATHGPIPMPPGFPNMAQMFGPMAQMFGMMGPGGVPPPGNVPGNVPGTGSSSGTGQGTGTGPTPRPASDTGSTPGSEQEPHFVQALRSMLQASATSGPQTSTSNTTTSSQSSNASSTPSSNQQASSQIMTDDIFANLVQGISGIVTRTAMGQGSQETISSFLSNLEGTQIMAGEGFINEVFNVLSSHLTFPDLIQVFYGGTQPLDRVRLPLQNFIRQRVLNDGQGTEANIAAGAERLIADMQEELRNSVTVSQVKPNIDLVETWNCFFRSGLVNVMTLIMNQEQNEGFGELLYYRMRTLLEHLIILTRYCLVQGMTGVERLMQDRLRYITRGVNPMIQQWMIGVTTQQLNQFLPTITTREEDIMHYVKNKQEAAAKPKTEKTEKPVPMETSPGVSQSPSPQAMDVEPSKPEAAAASNSHQTKPTTSSKKPVVNGNRNGVHVDEVTPSNIPDSPGAAVSDDSWQKEVPSDWVPVISNDIQRQKHQRPQQPVSDAYLNSMPAKRRKLMTNDRPGNLANTADYIPESIRRAVEAAGVEPISSMDNMTSEASDDLELHSAFEEQVTATIAARIESDSDYKPDRYPNTEECYQRNHKK